MTAIDMVLHLPRLSQDEVAGWVQASLAEYRALRRHDHRLFPTTEDPEALRAANDLRATWRRYAEDARHMLGRVQGPPEISASDRDELRLAVAYGKAIAEGPDADEMLRRVQRIERGESRLYTVEEVRRELGLSPRR
jgi:hypothetical protein